MKPFLPSVLVETKRKIDLVDEEHESEIDESKDEEPRIKDVLSNLSQALSNKERASELYRYSRDILSRTVTSK